MELYRPTEMFFCINHVSDFANHGSSNYYIISFVSINYWNEYKCFPDFDTNTIDPINKNYSHMNEEVLQWKCTLTDIKEIRHDMVSAGFTENKDVAWFLQSTYM